MFEYLSEKQRSIANYNQGLVVVKACPGSGKTFSVAARIATLLNNKEFKHKGIAAVSYTNVACDEVKEALKKSFGIDQHFSHPHYLGTLDGFINQYIFLPFGHLFMGCTSRPQLVGEPHTPWSRGKYDKMTNRFGVVINANPTGYFDITSFDIDDRLIPLASPWEYHFSFKPENYYTQKGRVNKRIQDIIDIKWQCFREGYANQADANYLALKVLETYPLILDNIAHKYEYLIIDEAQDTDAIKMRILELLSSSGLTNVMLIGDRDQSIFEWNSARPELFDQKYQEWEKIDLEENRRSSQKICDFSVKLSSFEKIHAVNKEVKDFDFEPEILGYKPESNSKVAQVSFEESKATFDSIMQRFIGICEGNGIQVNEGNVAVLYRSKSRSKYLGLLGDSFDFGNSPWAKGAYHVREIIRGKHLIECGDLKRGLRVIERGFLEAIERIGNPEFYCSQSHIDMSIETLGIRGHRNRIFDFIDCLPSTRGKTILAWTNEANRLVNKLYGLNLTIKRQHGAVAIDEYFASDLNSKESLPFFHGTIHSAKGKTFDAVLLLLNRKPGNKSNYATMITKGCKPGEDEELRNIYVAITRPRKVLIMAVPEIDVAIWQAKLMAKK